MIKEKVFLLDMDGTIYLGNDLIDGAAKFIETIRSHDKKVIFLTNNSSKSRIEYVNKLCKLGISAKIEDIFSSTEATLYYLKGLNKGNKVYLVGTPSFEESFKNAGFLLVSDNDNPDFVVLGYDTTLTYDKVRTACSYIQKGVAYIATHPDVICPIENHQYIPDIGSIIEMIKAVTKQEPLIIGKPYKHIIDAVTAEYKVSKEDLIITGDRIYTDIKTGVNAGISSVLVLSGETTKDDLEKSDVKPTYVFNSVKDMIPLI